MNRITFEVENRKDLNLLISIARKLGIGRFVFSEDSKAKTTNLQKFYQIIDKGADISSFGDINEWQQITRHDRNLKFDNQ